jgi:hypothetical protein
VQGSNKLDPAVTLDTQTPCSAIFQEQPIPDDGSWLQVCLLDPNAPDKNTVTEVNLDYLLDHPSPEQLEVRITRPQSDVSITLWDRGKLVTGTKFGEAINLDAFKGTPSQGE